jgi:predicted outer membrane repeat protein
MEASGGGIWARDAVTLVGSSVSGNGALGLNADGGGIYSPSVSLTNSTVGENTAGGIGGGVRAVFASLIDSSVLANTARGSGGGIFASGTVDLTNSTVSGNATTGDFARGGGLLADEDIRLANSTVSGNTTTGRGADGGGVFANGSVALINSTVSGNIAAGQYAGGGGVFAGFGEVVVTNSTIAGNIAGGEGGGIVQSLNSDNSSLTIHNSIIAGNLDNDTASDFKSPFGVLTVQNSIVGDTTGTTLTAGNNNQLDVDFKTVLETEMGIGAIVPKLADNGGSVQTIALLAGSPAIDAGDNELAVDTDGSPLLTDQRGAGFDRIVLGTVDIGAFEIDQVPATAPVITNVTRDEGGVLDRPDTITAFTVTFDQDVVVDVNDLTIANDTLGLSVDTAGVGFEYDSDSSTATWSFGPLSLAPAFYNFELSSEISGVAGGLTLQGNGNGDGMGGDILSEPVYVALPGDINLDGVVDVLNDAAELVNNLGESSNAVWALGDLNADGSVNVLGDALILVNNLGRDVRATATSVFNLSAISDDSSTRSTNALGLIDTGFARDESTDEDSQERKLETVVSKTPTLSGNQLIDSAFASDDWII